MNSGTSIGGDEGRGSGAALAFARSLIAFGGRQAIFGGALILLGALLEGLGLALVVPMTNLVFGTKGGSWQRWADVFFARVGAHEPLQRLIALALVIVALLALRAVVLRLKATTMAELQIGYVEDLRLRVAERLAGASWDKIAPLRHARITHVMSGDVQRVGTGVYYVLQAATALAMIVAQGALALLLSPVLAGIALLFFALGGLAIAPVLKRARQLGQFVTGSNLALLNETTQFLGGLKLAISQDLQHRFLGEFQSVLRGLASRQVDFVRQQTTSQIWATSVPAIFSVGLIVAGYGVFHVAPAVLVTLVAVVARLSGPAQQVMASAQQFAHALPAFAKIKELEEELAGDEPKQPSDAAATQPISGGVTFENVTFIHPVRVEGERGVKELSFSIRPGEFVGLAGPSGSGKTTTADLIVGLHVPQTGRVLIDGRPLEGSFVHQWRRSLSYVSQESFLLHTSLRRNLLWVCENAGEDDIWQALQVAGADDLVRRIGLDTMVGERGSLVSGGERQRIALAQAILRKPKLLILDEATNAIDVASEEAILARLAGMQPRPAILLIAHRAESLRFCERVLRITA